MQAALLEQSHRLELLAQNVSLAAAPSDAATVRSLVHRDRRWRCIYVAETAPDAQLRVQDFQ